MISVFFPLLAESRPYSCRVPLALYHGVAAAKPSPSHRAPGFTLAAAESGSRPVFSSRWMCTILELVRLQQPQTAADDSVACWCWCSKWYIYYQQSSEREREWLRRCLTWAEYKQWCSVGWGRSILRFHHQLFSSIVQAHRKLDLGSVMAGCTVRRNSERVASQIKKTFSCFFLVWAKLE